LLPSGAAVVGSEHDAAGGAGVGLAVATPCPAAMGVDEEDGIERAGDRGRLLAPRGAGVFSVPDHAAVADCPAGGRRDE
jgi:hypothetical protein